MNGIGKKIVRGAAACALAAANVAAQPTEVLFSFDTEDFTNPRSMDSMKELAELFSSEGITAHFCVVGYVGRALVERGRWDVIDAMRPHLKLSHTLMHSVHPNTSEVSETPDFDAAYQLLRARESLAVGMVMAGTGTEKVWGACPPGCSESAEAYYAWAEMGLPFYVGAVFANGNVGDDVWFCNLRQIPYSFSWEEYWNPKRKFDPAAFVERVAQKKRAIIYCHPNKVRSKEFWDMINYKGANLCEWGKWKMSEQRTEEEVKAYLDTIRKCLRMIKADPRFKITTMAELDAAKKPRRAITPADVPAIRDSLAKNFGAVRAPASWSVSDCFVAAVKFLRGEKEHLPALAYGFTETPKGVAQTTKVKRADLVAAAKTMDVSRFLPTKIRVGEATLGPADFLFAALDALATGAEEIAVAPRDQRGSYGPYPSIEKMSLKGTWLFGPQFEDKYVSEAIRNQIWTLRYE